MAWGAGHEDHARLVLKNLPPEIYSFWSEPDRAKIISEYSHYPDCTDKISEADRALIGSEYMKLVDGFIPTRYKFHSECGKAVSFVLLVKAFRDNRPDVAAIFAGALLHATADAGALNHGRLVNYITYCDYPGAKLPDMKFLDFSIVRNFPEISAAAEVRAKGMKTELPAADAQSGAIFAAVSAVDGGKIMAETETDFLKIKNGKPAAEYRAAAEKLFSYQIRQGVDLITLAHAVSLRGDIDLSEFSAHLRPLRFKGGSSEFARRYVKLREEKMSARNPCDDSVYAEFFRRANFAVAVAVEPVYDMNYSRTGFASGLYAAMFARTLKNSGVNVGMISLDDLRNGKLLPSASSVLVIFAMSLPEDVRAAVSKYVSGGGKIFYVGGNSDYGLAGLGGALKVLKNSEVPVSAEYGRRNDAEIKRMKIVSGGGEEFSFRANPNTAAGWTKPYCGAVVRERSASVRELFRLKTPDGENCIAAAVVENGKWMSAWAPMYLFAPNLFAEVPASYDWSRPALDPFGEKLALEIVNNLLKE